MSVIEGPLISLCEDAIGRSVRAITSRGNLWRVEWRECDAEKDAPHQPHSMIVGHPTV